MQYSIDFIIASPIVTSHFRRIRLLGSLYNTILLPCAHAQSCPSRIQSHHARAHGNVASLQSIMLINDRASARASLDGYRWYFRYLAIYGLAVYLIILCCPKASCLCHSAAHLCDHAPQPLCYCSLPILSTFIYRQLKKVTQTSIKSN